jgi:hypothetical protein
MPRLLDIAPNMWAVKSVFTQARIPIAALRLSRLAAPASGNEAVAIVITRRKCDSASASDHEKGALVRAFFRFISRWAGCLKRAAQSSCS